MPVGGGAIVMTSWIGSTPVAGTMLIRRESNVEEGGRVGVMTLMTLVVLHRRQLMRGGSAAEATEGIEHTLWAHPQELYAVA